MDEAGLIEVIAILTELSRCLLEVSDDILPVHRPWKWLFTFMLSHCTCYQKSMTWIRCDCEVRDVFHWLREVLQKSSKEPWSNFWVGYLIAALYIPFEHLQVMYLCWLEMESQKYKKKKKIFFSNLESYSQIPLRKQKSRLHIFHCLQNSSQYIKMHTIICHNLSWHCSLLPLSPVLLLTEYSADCRLLFGCCWVMAAHPGLGQATR